MSFLTPLFLLLGLLAIPIILMYMLRLRRRAVVVSSTMLWQELLRDREANAPWQKLKRNLLLFLQLLILAALAFALARPFFPVPSVVNGSVVVLLDGSASMQTQETEGSRFALALAQAEEIISDLSGGNEMTLILVGQQPEVVASASADKRLLRDSLNALTPTNGTSDWASAFALASGAAQGFQDARIVIISDGGLPNNLPPIAGEVVYLPVGSAQENIAISALATRQTKENIQLFSTITNYGSVPQSALISIEVDGQLLDSQRITVETNQPTTLTWELAESDLSEGKIGARLSELSADSLPLDNEAYTVHDGGVSNRALLVTDGNLFLEQVFSVMPNTTLFTANSVDLEDESFDLYIFDGIDPPEGLKSADLFIINPQTTTDLYTVSGTIETPATTRLADSPILQFIDWGTVAIREAQAVSAPWAQTIIGSDEGALLLAGERNGNRVAILTFDVRNSDLPLKIAFPILFNNISQWLTPGRAFDANPILGAGDVVSLIPSPSATNIIVRKPDGESWQTNELTADLLFTESDTLGWYNVALREAEGLRNAGSFAVNLFSDTESNVRPVTEISVAQSTLNAQSETNANIGQYELWPWLIALALLVLLIEWWVHHRGLSLKFSQSPIPNPQSPIPNPQSPIPNPQL